MTSCYCSQLLIGNQLHNIYSRIDTNLITVKNWYTYFYYDCEVHHSEETFQEIN